MRRGQLLAIGAGLLTAVAGLPGPAFAARVIVLGPNGHASVRNDPFLSARAITPAPSPAPGPSRGRLGGRVTANRKTALATAHRKVTLATAARARRRPQPLTPASVLVSLRRRGAITSAQYAHYRGDLRQTAGSLLHLSGTRHSELESVVQNLFAIAAAHELTPSRLPALFLTLERNRQWWTTGPLLASGQRVEFTGSQLVWEYYPGQGIELQELGSFGKADGLYTAGQAQYAALHSLVGELIPLAVNRAGGLAWEYYFKFDGGRPPWVSAMAQGTALEALTRAYKATSPLNVSGDAAAAASGNPSYLAIAHRALPLLNTPPPAGVAVGTPLGQRFLQYSFAPGASIINAFLQTLIGLYDYASVSGDRLAAKLFRSGNAEAQAELPQFDTGAWSLYQPGVEDTLSYHQLVTGFLQELCQRTNAPAYCVTAQHFNADLTTPPALTLLSSRASRGRPFVLRFHLSKYSHVGVVVLHGDATQFLTSADFAYGENYFSIPALPATGSYSIRLAATDLAGNFNRITGTLTVTR